MGSVVLVADETVAARRDVVYRLFGAGHGAGAFLARYHDAFGPWAPPVSTLSESTYSAVHLYGAAARQAREDDPGQVTAALQRLRTVVPRGSVQLAGPHQIRQQLHLAEASAGGFRLLNFAR